VRAAFHNIGMALTAKIVVETDPAMMGIVASIAVLLAFLPQRRVRRYVARGSASFDRNTQPGSDRDVGRNV